MRLPKERLVFVVDFAPIESIQSWNIPDNASPLEYTGFRSDRPLMAKRTFRPPLFEADTVERRGRILQDAGTRRARRRP